MKITKRQLRRIIKEEKAKVLIEGRNLALRDALMNAYEYAYDELTLQGVDPSEASRQAVSEIMSEVEALLDATGVSSPWRAKGARYVGMS